MALKKEIELDNGIVMNYHRVVSVNSITNQISTIEVASYISESQRNKEASYQELQKRKVDEEELTEEEQQELENGINVLIDTKYYSTDYNKELNVDNAYEYLKTLDEFNGAEDV